MGLVSSARQLARASLADARRRAHGALRVRWRRVVLAHWPLGDPAPLERALPAGVRLARHEGLAWLGLAASVVEGPAPGWLLPATGRLEVALRTCVVGPAGPGHLLVDRRASRPGRLASWVLDLPLQVDLAVAVEVTRELIGVRSEQEVLVGTPLPGPARPLQPGSLEGFLLDRPWSYALRTDGGLVGVRLAHASWELGGALLSSAARGPAALGQLAAEVTFTVTDVRRFGPPSRP